MLAYLLLINIIIISVMHYNVFRQERCSRVIIMIVFIIRAVVVIIIVVII